MFKAYVETGGFPSATIRATSQSSVTHWHLPSCPHCHCVRLRSSQLGGQRYHLPAHSSKIAVCHRYTACSPRQLGTGRAWWCYVPGSRLACVENLAGSGDRCYNSSLAFLSQTLSLLRRHPTPGTYIDFSFGVGMN